MWECVGLQLPFKAQSTNESPDIKRVGISSWLAERIYFAVPSRWTRGKTPHQWTSKASCWTWGSTAWASSRPLTSCASPTWLSSKEPSISWETPLYRYLHYTHTHTIYIICAFSCPSVQSVSSKRIWSQQTNGVVLVRKNITGDDILYLIFTTVY